MKKKLKHRLVWLLTLALCLLAMDAMFDSIIRQMLYPAPPVPVGEPPAPLEEVRLELEGGEVVIAWAFENPQVGEGAPAVVFFHGNGENLETMRYGGFYEQLAALGIHFLAVDFPGYGRSTGTPSEANLTAAGVAAFDWLREQHPESPTVLCGWSLGAAVAMQTAARRGEHLGGLVLLSAWDEVARVAGVHFPQFLVNLALSDRYDSVAAARKVRSPVLMIHGERDDLIPVEHGRRLHGAFEVEARWVEVRGTGHNDLLGRGVVWEELGRFFGDL